MRARDLLVPTVLLASLSAACAVRKEDYDAALQSAASAQQSAAAAQDGLRTCNAERDALKARIAGLEETLGQADKLLAERTKSVAEEQAKAAALKKQLDDATLLENELEKQLKKLGKDADKLLAEKGSLSSALELANARLEELRKAQAAADARARLFRELALKFQKMIDAGELKIVLRGGRMVIQLPNDVLFDSGKTELKPAGKKAIEQVGAVLATLGDRRFQVGGNTDTVPIHNDRFPSNWELSTARAVEVVRFLVSKGVKPTALSAAGYGEFDPVASNDTPDGKAKNRRIEIALQPNIEELVAVPEGK
jgi:chemotaxis protein MotB